MAHDAIIIGSGLGGLVAAAKLAKEGKKVLVVEQHSVPGGYATCFTQEGFTIDVGLQSMDGLYERDPKIKIFEDLDVYFNVDFEQIPTGYYRFTNGRVDFALPDKREDAIKVLITEFPKEEKNIKKFFNEIEKITADTHKIPRNKAVQAIVGPIVPLLFPSIPKWGRRNAGFMLDKFFKDEDLKLALVGTIKYYGDDPYTLSAIIFALALSSHFKGGNHYIKGGSMKLSGHLVNFIREHGGTVLLSHKVTKILVRDGTAYGVEYVSKKLPQAGPIQAHAKFIIANASAPQVINEMLPEDSAMKLKEKIKDWKIGHATTNIFFGFNAELKEIGNRDFTTVFNDPSVFNLKDVFINNYADFKKRSFLFVDYSQVESGMAPAGKSTGIISFIDSYEYWSELSEEEYDKRKNEVVAIFLQRLLKLLPSVKDHIAFVNIATPLTKSRYTLNPRGTAIGFAQTVSQTGMKRLKSKSPIKNLYFSSAWTFPGGGFSSTIWAGWQCAIQILSRRR